MSVILASYRIFLSQANILSSTSYVDATMGGDSDGSEFGRVIPDASRPSHAASFRSVAALWTAVRGPSLSSGSDAAPPEGFFRSVTAPRGSASSWVMASMFPSPATLPSFFSSLQLVDVPPSPLDERGSFLNAICESSRSDFLPTAAGEAAATHTAADPPLRPPFHSSPGGRKKSSSPKSTAHLHRQHATSARSSPLSATARSIS
mmetsp:Transcript_9664/g.23610  ORF Transcript_9664/g.23610 Transcript_9664/m.23610 type:complete len:205 (-) Transcript_9664:610-1224(-)